RVKLFPNTAICEKLPTCKDVHRKHSPKQGSTKIYACFREAMITEYRPIHMDITRIGSTTYSNSPDNSFSKYLLQSSQ
ncbi:MAG: hypothetical protein KAR13_16605, partial [Desulfobulbaceae bacterium]|nr:hypothetical protein [Desulfobulbaceae bacterium]